MAQCLLYCECSAGLLRKREYMKIAIVTDWLTVYAGAERVLEQILIAYPDADVFALCDFVSSDQRAFLQNKTVKTSFIQRLPFAKRHYRQYLLLMPIAIEQLDVSQYDLIISSSHAVAKGILTGPDQLHISYVHSPIRYAWDLQHQYLNESGLTKGLKSILARWILHKIRLWDIRTANGVDYFISNSNFIGRRIWKVYRRESITIYPPVAVDDFQLNNQKEDFYVTASRMVPYKKIDLIVDAFNQMPDKKLVVIGEGPDFKKISARAGQNIILMGYQSFDVMKNQLERAKAFVFAAEEDFGITPVEAQACGTPVIAFGKGGTLETIIDRKTGLFYHEQTVESLVNAVLEFETLSINPQDCRDQAIQFSQAHFKERLTQFIAQKYDAFKCK